MEALFQMISNTKALDTNRVFEQVFSIAKYQEYVISRNTWGQLYEKGVDASGKVVGHYSHTSLKYNKGVKKSGDSYSPGDHYTFRDSGDFFNSFRLKAYYGYLEINSNPLKDDGSDWLNGTTEDLLGLTEESKEQLVDYIKGEEDVKEIIKETILRNN